MWGEGVWEGGGGEVCGGVRRGEVCGRGSGGQVCGVREIWEGGGGEVCDKFLYRQIFVHKYLKITKISTCQILPLKYAAVNMCSLYVRVLSRRCRPPLRPVS